MSEKLKFLRVVVGCNPMLVHPGLSQNQFVSACIRNIQPNVLRVIVVTESQFDGVRDFTTVEYSSSKSSGVNDVGERVLIQLHVAREISMDVSYTSGTSINQGLQAALDGTLLNRAWYRDGMLPRGLRGFRPKLVRDAVDAVSQGAT